MDGGGETFGQILCRLRGKRSLSAVGRLANISKGHVHDLENGRRMPSRSVALKLDEVLYANGELIAAFESHATNGEMVDFRQTVAEMGSVRTLKMTANDDGEDVTNRRRLLQLAASAGIFGYGESVRQLLDRMADPHRSIEEWQIVREDHLHALRTRPPAEVVDHLAIDLHALWEQMAAIPADERIELHRVAAILANVQANALTRLGDHGQAIRWWGTSRRMADASKDVDLQLLVRAEEAGQGLYGQRSPGTVLLLIAQAERISRRPWPRMLTAEAEALAMLGRHREAAQKLRTLVDLVEGGLKGDDFGFWKEDAIPFAQSWVYSSAGDERAASRARERVLRLAPERSYQVLTNVLLHQNQCTVELGGVDEGVRHAAEVFDALPTPYRTNHVMETARMVLRAVPIDQQTRPAVRDLRAMLTIEA
ncbi:helix-turn-helix domain-containing protein [Nonomuraea jiangxiensis]|uniref:Helix-turn-helix domain-containing protein n=1 Tax=Nonomuraea jiangxiensis TaxID=633440 RepID=A0A1G7YV08_9ACTN|nr:helix-turn-helix transcriptional regulator [Nonomuraea jiangxiensis]SDH00311.1 Helix-turn-helix domain-containing protein [Nonomuraea jiangxiensis]